MILFFNVQKEVDLSSCCRAMNTLREFSNDLPFCLRQGPHFVAVNNKNEIIVTDFHNHSVKVRLALCCSLVVDFGWCNFFLLFFFFFHCSSVDWGAVGERQCLSRWFQLFQVYNADGEFLFKFGSHGEGNGQFNAPTGVAVDANGNIIVADWGNSRIQVGLFSFLGVS